jgi:hypothetical protein
MNILIGKKKEYSQNELNRFKEGCFILIKYRGDCKYIDCSDNCPFYSANSGIDCGAYWEDLPLIVSAKKWLKRYVGMTQQELDLFANQAEIERLNEEKEKLQEKIDDTNEALNERYIEMYTLETGIKAGEYIWVEEREEVFECMDLIVVDDYIQVAYNNGGLIVYVNHCPISMLGKGMLPDLNNDTLRKATKKEVNKFKKGVENGKI